MTKFQKKTEYKKGPVYQSTEIKSPSTQRHTVTTVIQSQPQVV